MKWHTTRVTKLNAAKWDDAELWDTGKWYVCVSSFAGEPESTEILVPCPFDTAREALAALSQCALLFDGCRTFADVESRVGKLGGGDAVRERIRLASDQLLDAQEPA